MRIAGLHLAQSLEHARGRPRSAIAEVDGAGRVTRLVLAGSDAEILAALPGAPALVVVDAALAVPNADGRRDLEVVLSWCDVPLFPTSRRRLERVYGGARGVSLAAQMAARGLAAVEASPDLVLRELLWERSHPADAPPLELRTYREAWLGVRAPAYRPKGRGRARPAALAEAHALLAGALDLGDWAPAPDPGDWEAIEDAARLDALACAYAGLRHLVLGDSLLLGTRERGRILIPADRNLAGRIALHVERLRAQGAVALPPPDSGGPGTAVAP